MKISMKYYEKIFTTFAEKETIINKALLKKV